jgi:hypothetical protein
MVVHASIPSHTFPAELFASGLEPSKGGENRQDSCKGSEKQHLGVAADLGPIQRWDITNMYI